MPDLGNYAAEVLLAYAVSLMLLAGIIVLSVWQARRASRDLAEIEKRRNG